MAHNRPVNAPASIPPAPVTRSTDGRWIGGVCAGFARAQGHAVGRIRAGFLAAGLLGGLGAVIYLVCWLVIPAEGEATESADPRGPAVVARALAVAACLIVLAGLAAAATVFGFGWAVLAAAAVVLAVGLGSGRLPGPGWVLLPVAALALPSMAVAMSDVRLAPQVGLAVHAPARVSSHGATYRGGLGTMLVDLRHSALPASGQISLHIDGGVRRTIVALPAGACVRVRVHYRVHTFVSSLTTLLSGRQAPPFSEVVLFGRQYGIGPGEAVSSATRPGPVLNVDFSSQGGSLYVRDYPDKINPTTFPDWPGYAVTLEPYPNLSGEPKRAAEQMVADWRFRVGRERASQRFVNANLNGPCVAPPALPALPRAATTAAVTHRARRSAPRKRRRRR
jgi:phage shock protein PspC (stress-responsive transcriptional regulator)